MQEREVGGTKRERNLVSLNGKRRSKRQERPGSFFHNSLLLLELIYSRRMILFFEISINTLMSFFHNMIIYHKALIALYSPNFFNIITLGTKLLVHKLLGEQTIPKI